MTDVYSQRAVCFAFLHYSCMQKDCHTILNVAEKHAAQMMQMDFTNRVISSLTSYRGVFNGVFRFLHPCELLSAATKLSYGLRDRSLDAQCLLPIEIEGNYFAADRTLLFVCVCMRACMCVMPPQPPRGSIYRLCLSSSFYSSVYG